MYNPQEVSELSAKLLEFLAGYTNDVGVKVAALKTAAATYENTIGAQAMAGMLNQLLNGGPNVR